MPFKPGQRWISDAENELGLGTVVAIDARTVTLLFPASGENRLYSRLDAPITRVLFSPGDIITSHEGWQLKVEQVEEEQGLLTYTGVRLDNDSPETPLREVMLDNRMTFSKPQDRLFAAQIDRLDRFTLRYQARQHLSQQFKMPWSGLRGMRASLIPHQLFIAHEVSQRYAPRVLLADEVGLGKTIEAGMIIHQQLLSGRVERVLIVVPDSLQYQWIVEMMRRFNLYFSLFDDDRYAAACAELSDSEDKENAHSNPFETEQLLLCSLDFVCRRPERLAQLAAANWDLLVVDEAHHLQWSEESPSPQYQAIATLAQQIAGVLLLTATPEQLGQQSHFARLHLLDHNRFHSYPEFVKEQQNYRPVADAVALLIRNDTLSAQQLNLLSDLIEEQNIEPLLKAANSQNSDRDSARQELVQMLMDRHGTSRVLFRNTRQGVKGFPQRQLHQIKLPLPHQYQTLFKVNTLLNGEQDSESL
ncbi:MAG: RNA polymerase-associated protein RapA, partial [Enterobacteriaceae bacterium]